MINNIAMVALVLVVLASIVAYIKYQTRPDWCGLETADEHERREAMRRRVARMKRFLESGKR